MKKEYKIKLRGVKGGVRYHTHKFNTSYDKQRRKQLREQKTKIYYEKDKAPAYFNKLYITPSLYNFIIKKKIKEKFGKTFRSSKKAVDYESSVNNKLQIIG